VFDPDSMSWRELASCPCEPRLHPTFVANNGKIFVGLGNNNNGNQNDWWEYDIASNTWSQKPNFPGLVRHHPYQFAIGDYVYTGMGHGNGAIYKDLYRYDPATEEWLQVADIPGEGRVAGTQFSYNNRGYVLSGDGDDHLSMETGEFWMYDPALDAWQELTPHPGKSRWAPSSFIINGEVYLFNGTSFFQGSGSVYQSESYKFNLDSLFTSTKPIVQAEDLQMYPNPFTSEVRVAHNDLFFESIRVYTLDQKLVYQGRLENNTNNLSYLPSGTYRVEGLHDRRLYSGLIVKQ
jgi:N-acetylneuraminic acid mutarotase